MILSKLLLSAFVALLLAFIGYKVILIKIDLKKRRQEKQLLESFLKNVNSIPDKNYLESKKKLISDLEWLIAYYYGRTGTTPEKLLEAYINNTHINPEELLPSIRLFYYWTKYKVIVGF